MQSSFITHHSCPACHSGNIYSVLQAKDYLVSGLFFEIWECGSCTLRFTQNIPDATAIGSYYQSENYISHTDNSKGLVNRLYRSVRRKTLEGKERLVSSATDVKSGTLLDIGAGTGAFIHHMQMRGWKTTGLEPDAGARQKAAELYKVELLPAENLSGAIPDSFDAISLWHVLEHVHELHSYLEQLKKILRPRGRIFIAVPNYTSYDATVFKGYWAAYDVPRHLYHFSPGSLKQLLEQHGFKLYGMYPMWYDSFYISLLSEKYKTGHSNMIKSFFTGFVSNMKTVINRKRCSSVIYVGGK